MSLVIFTIAFQSIHIYKHFFLEDKHHHHEGCKEKKDCSICDFSFWYFISPETLVYRFDFPYYTIPYSGISSETISFFSGSNFLLRGPPKK